jgi:dienelactone hydrolase
VDSRRGSSRRHFLAQVSAAGVVASFPGLAAESPRDDELLVGSPREPSVGIRDSDFYTRSNDLGEAMEMTRRVRKGDLDSYLREWTAIRDRTRQKADLFERDGRRVTAANTYLRASNYSNRIYNLYLRLGDRGKGIPAYRVVRDLFNHGVELAGDGIPFERVRFGYKNHELNGFFFPAAAAVRGRRAPAVYRTGGADSVKESSYSTSTWAPFVERGVSCLVFDAPGQGEALNLQDLPLIAPFEHVVTAAVDYLAGRADVAPDRIGVYGTSMGGYFAGRGAAFEKRPAALVLQSAWYDVLADSYDHCPSFRPHLRYMIGASDDADARRILGDFNFRGVAARITTPIAIAHGDQDEVVRFEGGRRLFDEVASREKAFTAVPNSRHNLDGEVTNLVDWMCGRLTAGS